MCVVDSCTRLAISGQNLCIYVTLSHTHTLSLSLSESREMCTKCAHGQKNVHISRLSERERESVCVCVQCLIDDILPPLSPASLVLVHVHTLSGQQVLSDSGKTCRVYVCVCCVLCVCVSVYIHTLQQVIGDQPKP